MGQQDPYVKNPLVVQQEAQFSGLPIEQKRRQVEKLISEITIGMSDLVTQRMKAQASLTAYEQANPIGNDPSQMRLRQLDSLIAQKQKEQVVLTARQDSLDVQIGNEQGIMTQLAQAAGKEIVRLNAMLRDRMDEKTAAVTQRAQASKDSAQVEQKGSGNLNKIKGELHVVNSRLVSLQNELAELQTRQSKTKSLLATAQEKDRQSKTYTQKESRRLDSLISSKEQQIALMSRETEQMTQKRDAAAKDFEKKKLNTSGPAMQLENSIKEKNKDKAFLSSQRDSIVRVKSSIERQNSGQLSEVIKQINATQRELNAQKSELETLRAQRQQALGNLQNEKVRIENAISAEEATLRQLENQRSQAKNDSVAAERAIGDNSGKTTPELIAFDKEMTAAQIQLNNLTIQYEKARQDSAKASGARDIAIAPYKKSIRKLDSTIYSLELELQNLKGERDRARQDSAQEYRRQTELAQAAYAEVAKKSRFVEAQKNQIEKRMADRKRLQQDSAAAVAQSRSSVMQYAQQIVRLTSQIEMQKSTIADLQQQLAEMSSSIPDAKPVSYTSTTKKPTPAALVSSAKINSSESAQKYVEELYTLLGDNKIDEALQRYQKQKTVLSKYLDSEAFQALKGTMEAMAQ